jgi:ribosomal protein L37E
VNLLETSTRSAPYPPPLLTSWDWISPYEICVLCTRPPLWSSGQSSWLQIRRHGFDSRHYQKKKFSGSGTGSTQLREYNWGATW